HRVHEYVAAFLRADPAEATDGVAARQSGFRARRGAISRWGVGLGIDAVHDDISFALEKGLRYFAGGDDRVHPPDQPARDPAVVALRRGVEHQFQGPAERPQQYADDHLVVAPRMPDQGATAAPQFHEVRNADP